MTIKTGSFEKQSMSFNQFDSPTEMNYLILFPLSDSNNSEILKQILKKNRYSFNLKICNLGWAQSTLVVSPGASGKDRKVGC